MHSFTKNIRPLWIARELEICEVRGLRGTYHTEKTDDDVKNVAETSPRGILCFRRRVQ